TEHPLVLLCQQILGGQTPAIPGNIFNMQTSDGSEAFAKKYGRALILPIKTCSRAGTEEILYDF
ncbi:MAG: hypothetical protein M1472_01545, partial [Planctomycetes bacterium]|nr:hypothetical protein [Planctomycetota bacterium]